MQSSSKIRQREFRTAGKLGLRFSRETHVRMGSRCPDSPRWQKPNCLPEQFSNKLERVLLTFRSHFKSIIFSYRLGFQKNNKEKGETIFILEFESRVFNRGINNCNNCKNIIKKCLLQRGLFFPFGFFFSSFSLGFERT